MMNKQIKLNNLQGLRFLAFLFVFYNHSCWLLNTQTFYLGARGVEIFFCLAGFLIAMHYHDANSGVNLLDSCKYCINKIKKFYVLHITTFVVFFVPPFIKLLEGQFSEAKIYNFWKDAILNILLLRSWAPEIEFGFNGPTWFLSSLLFSYFLVPQIVNIFKKKNFTFFIISFFLVLLIKVYIFYFGVKFKQIYDFVDLYVNPAYRFLDFLLGYIFYLIMFKEKTLITDRILVILQLVIFVGYIISCFVFYKVCTPAIYVLFTLLLIYILSFNNNITNKLLGNKVLVYLGNISFELFMLHMIAIKSCQYLNKSIFSSYLPKYDVWVMSLFVSILLGIFVYEKPWKHFFSLK